MRTKVITGLPQRNGIWHIDKKVDGVRLYESTRVSDQQEAERYLIHRLEQLRLQKVYRIRQVRLWKEAAARFIKEFKDQPSIQLTVQYLKQVHPFIASPILTTKRLSRLSSTSWKWTVYQPGR